ncbi:class I SAM-dependent methyltransferase [Pseudomonas sp. NPDC089734]|uniref:class I SAM-dependent methyltransferase n=1 Tax=Pseudomonas sp. NPDC089734 TaxID=3364469 RepID=UPI00381B3FEA
MNQYLVQHPQTVEDYASQYSSDFVSRWDELIDWDLRKEGENGFFENLLKRAGARRVIDVSTGSGFHSVQLKKAGLNVVATDGSPTMLTKARHNFQKHGLDIETHHLDWLALDPSVLGTFDALVCLGSSLCHVFEEIDRLKVLANFKALLKPGGLLVVDQRNFFAICAGRYKSSGQYYYCGGNASVTLGEVNSELCEFIYTFEDDERYSLKVYPLLPEQLKSELNASGFSYRDMYGDFKRPFDMLSADFVIHTAVAL